MKLSLKNWVLLSLVAGIFGCQAMPYQPYARDVKKRPGQGGVIALRTEHREEDQQKAQSMMSSNCGGNGVKVLEEGEAVVGQETRSSADTNHHAATPGSQVGTLFGIPVMSGSQAAGSSTSGTAVTTAVKEWQINYECVATASNSHKKTK